MYGALFLIKACSSRGVGPQAASFCIQNSARVLGLFSDGAVQASGLRIGISPSSNGSGSGSTWV